MPARSVASGAALLLVGIHLAFGQQVGDPTSGKRLVDATCAQCHGAAATNPGAPKFTAIAAMPSTTAESLGVFLRTSHRSMPNIILSNSERDDVIAYILSLRP